MYDRLRRERPNFVKHIVIIEGDTAAANLGLSSTFREFLTKNTHIVFHVAADIRFKERLRNIANANVRGIKLMLQLAKAMPNLKVM